MNTTYPYVAGYREDSTSKDAAEAIEATGRALTLRERVWSFFLQGRHATADEVAHELRESILAIRPRVTELFKQGKIERTGMKRRSDGGHSAHVFRVACG